MKKSFSWRVFISFGLFIALFMMLVSGVILYISPHGRVANWTDWQIIGLTKRGWQHQHIIFGFSFLILSLFHLFFINWKAFLCYLKSKTSAGLNNPRELLVIIALSLLFGTGTYFGLQPFSSVIKLGDSISGSWERQEKQPPVPHAELMNLTQLAEQPGLGGDAAALKAKLEQAGLTVVSEEQTLTEIAVANKMTAEKVYEFIAPEETGGHGRPGQGFGKRSR